MSDELSQSSSVKYQSLFSKKSFLLFKKSSINSLLFNTLCI